MLLKLIKHVLVKRSLKLEVELPFGNTKLIACGLTVAGVLIMVSSRRASSASRRLSNMGAFWIGAVQGLCLPFRGFSRSGATISTSLLTRVERRRAEEFSVALAVVLTPAVVMREAMRFHKAYSAGLQGDGF